MATNVFQPVLSQPSSPVQALAPVQRPDTLGPIINLGTEAFDIGGDIVVQNAVVGKDKFPETVEPDKEDARFLGEIDEDALIDQEVTFSRVRAAWLAGLSGERAKALVDSKVKQAINKFPFLANKIRKKRDEFFGAGAGGRGGSFFKDPESFIDIITKDLLKEQKISLSDANDPGMVMAIQASLSETNRANARLDLIAKQRTERDAKQEDLDKEQNLVKGEAWTKAQPGVQSQLRAIRELVGDNRVLGEELLGNFESQGIAQLTKGDHNELTRSASASYVTQFTNMVQLERDRMSGKISREISEEKGKLLTSTAMNAFAQIDLASSEIIKKTNFSGAINDLGRDATADWVRFLGIWEGLNYTGSVYNIDPEVLDLARDVYNNPERHSIKALDPKGEFDLANGANTLVRTMVDQSQDSGASNPENYKRMFQLISAPGVGLMFKKHPELVNSETRTAFNSMTAERVRDIGKLLEGQDTDFLELVGSDQDVKFVIRSGVDLSFAERTNLVAKAAALNKDVAPLMNVLARAEAHVNLNVGNYGESMDRVAANYNTFFLETAEGKFKASSARLAEIDRQIAAVPAKGRGRGQRLSVLNTQKRAELDKIERLDRVPGTDGQSFSARQARAEQRKQAENKLQRNLQISATTGIPVDELTPEIIDQAIAEGRGETLAPTAEAVTPVDTGQVPVDTAIPEDAITFTPKDVSIAAKPLSELRGTGNIFIGQAAIDEVEKREGTLTAAQRRVVELEGFVNVPYQDKGGKAIGVGQLGEFLTKTFKESFKIHEDRTRKFIPSYDELPEALQAELVQATYRGDIGISPKFRKLFNAGKFSEAATEFLNNDEFRSPGTLRGIKTRMQSVADAVRAHAEGTLPTTVAPAPVAAPVAEVEPTPVAAVEPTAPSALPTRQARLAGRQLEGSPFKTKLKTVKEAPVPPGLGGEEKEYRAFLRAENKARILKGKKRKLTSFEERILKFAVDNNLDIENLVPEA